MEHVMEDTLHHLEWLRVSLLMDKVDKEMYSSKIIFKDTHQFYQPLVIDGYPVFQFRYEGAMPLYKETDRKYLALVREYYYQVTLSMYDFTEVNFQFKKAVLIIQHIFKNGIIRDLDNRNRKYLIDAIRHTGLIDDDNFKNLSILEEGFINKECAPYVNVYLLEEQYLQQFFIHKNDLTLHNRDKFENVISWNEVREKMDNEETKKVTSELKMREEMWEFF